MRAPEFWARPDSAATRLLAPLACAWTMAGRARRHLVRPAHVPVPVICVGNLVAGGAGKTPVVAALARYLGASGVAAHILTRGYGGWRPGPLRVDPTRQGFAEVGDEALLLAREAPTWIARDRRAGAWAAVAAGARIILMDDGFQNPSLHKDHSILVIDGNYGLGNGRVMPAGPLREPPGDGLARADACILIGADRAGIARALPADLPLHRARLVPAAGGADLGGRRLLAFAGIGRPAKFFATLRDLGADPAVAQSFPDHHRFREDELLRLEALAAGLGARLVTTDKDAVRLPPSWRARVAVLRVTVAWEDVAAIGRVLARVA